MIISASDINDVLYCERLLYLHRVQEEFADNYFIADGNFVHRRVDVPEKDVPAPTEERPYTARALWLSSDQLGITAKIDVLEGEDGIVTPVEYKRGKPPDVPERAWIPERAQVCAQVLLLREHGYRCERGEIYFAAAKTRVEVVIDNALIEVTLTAAKHVRELAAFGVIPPPLVESPKCAGCSLIGICLPDEVNALRTGAAIRPISVARDDKLPLHVQEPGARIGLSGECLVVHSKDGGKVEQPLAFTSQVCVYGNVQVSTQAMRDLLQRNVPLSFFSTGGWFCGRAVSSDSKNVELRLAQYKATMNQKFCLRFAIGIIEAKVKNCRTLLRRNTDAAENLEYLTWISAASSAESLLGIEGVAAARYFEHFSQMLRPPSGLAMFDFTKRNRRPPKDPVNALLSFAYSLLAKDFTLALSVTGLDPLLGFYHQPRFGRPSLALDLMEEFRPIVADSVVITAINTGVVKEKDFVRAADSVALIPRARRDFIQAYERRMAEEVTHPVFGYRVSYRRVIEIQARLLARHILGEIGRYPQFLVR